MLFYVKTRSDKDFRIRWPDLLHFIPVVLAFIDLIPFYMSDAASKQALLVRMSKDLRFLPYTRTGIMPDIWHVWIRPVHGLIYAGIAGRYLNRSLHNKKLRKEIDVHRGLRTWLILLTSFFAVIYLGLILMNVLWIILPYTGEQWMSYTVIPLFLCVAPFLALHVFLFFNTQIIFGKLPVRRKFAGPEPDTEQPAPDGREEAQIRDIEALILRKELFKNPKITAPETAALLGLAPHTFSALIQAHYGKRFPDFINAYRINHVISELEKGSNNNMSIEGIAIESGFASRSAFYNSFKKITGLTPSEYVKQHKQS